MASMRDGVVVPGESRRCWSAAWVQWNGHEPVYQRRRRAAVLAVLTVLYSQTIVAMDSSLLLSSAAWREILGELHPDAPKSAERLTEGEVVPRWAETLHADDVTKQLNWFQTFCRQKFGMDDHIEFYWRCDIVDVQVEGLNDQSAADPHMNCSQAFVDRHIIFGDDLRCVPYGPEGLEIVQQRYGYESNVAKISPVFDEYTVLDSSPLFEPILEPLGRIEKQLQKLINSHDRVLSSKRSVAGLQQGQQDEPLRTEIDASEIEASEAWCSAVKACPWSNGDEASQDLVCYCFRGKDPKTVAVANVCRNHHWGLVHLCQPSKIKVLFVIEQEAYRSQHQHWKGEITGKRSIDRTLYFYVHMIFESASAGWYSAKLDLDEGEFPGKKTALDGIMALASLALFWYCLVGHLGRFLIHCPARMRDVLRLRESSVMQSELLRAQTLGREMCARELFEVRVYRLLDPCSARSSFLGFTAIGVELVIAALFILGIVSSMAKKNEWVRDLDVKSVRIESSFRYITSHLSGLPMWVELVYDQAFDATFCHSLAWFLLYFHTFFMFIGDVAGLRWLSYTVALGFENTLYFFVFYCCLLFGFGMVMWVQLGAHFVQFSSLQRVNIELFLLSFGFPSQAFDDIYPFEDSKSFVASLYLATFLLLAVTIALNFFTTILLDAYTLAHDPAGPEQNMQEHTRRSHEQLMALLGISHRSCPGDGRQVVELARPRKSLRFTLSSGEQP